MSVKAIYYEPGEASGSTQEAKPPPQQPRQIVPTADETKPSIAKVVLFVWFRTLRNSLQVLFAPVMVMFAVYLPSWILSEDKISDIFYPFYFSVLVILWRFSVALMIALVLVQVYSYEMSKKIMYLSVIPVYLLVISPLALDSVNYGAKAGFGNYVNPFYLLGLYAHKYNKNQPNDSTLQREYNDLIRDGTPAAIALSVLSVIVSMLIFMGLLAVYLESNFLAQILIRFVIFGVLFSATTSFQQYLVIYLSPEYMDRRLRVLIGLNVMFQMLGRLMIFSVDSSQVTSAFLIMNVFNLISEIALRSIFLQRHAFLQVFRSKLSRVMSFIPCFSTTQTRVIQVHAADDLERDHGQGVRSERSGCLGLLTHPADPPDDVKLFRAKSIIDSMDAELRALILISILLYLANPLFPDSYIRPISSFPDLIGDITIQLLTQFISDTISLYIEIRYLGLPITIELMKTVRPSPLDYTTTMFSAFFIHSRLLAAVYYRPPNHAG